MSFDVSEGVRLSPPRPQMMFPLLREAPPAPDHGVVFWRQVEVPPAEAAATDAETLRQRAQRRITYAQWRLEASWRRRESDAVRLKIAVHESQMQMAEMRRHHRL